jgi:hypothetical protein
VISKLFLCAFASPDLFLSKKRFLTQARNINFYRNIKIYGVDDLKKNTKDQINKYLLTKNRRGYGYWLWKPEIVLDFLKKIPENSILQYSDIGCHINRKGFKRIGEYQNICDKKNMLTFQYSDPPNRKIDLIYPNYLEFQYTKADLMNFLDINYHSIHMSSPQIWSGTFFIKKNEKNIKFMESWLRIFENMNLIDDSMSVAKNNNKFIEHRHDQSAFSLLCKLNNFFSLSVYEHCEWALDKKGRNWSHLLDCPILAKRDLKYISFYAAKERFKKIYKRIIK